MRLTQERDGLHEENDKAGAACNRDARARGGHVFGSVSDTTSSAEAPAASGDREKASSEASKLPQTGDSSVYLLAAGTGSIVLLAGMGLAKKQS